MPSMSARGSGAALAAAAGGPHAASGSTRRAGSASTASVPSGTSASEDTEGRRHLDELFEACISAYVDESSAASTSQRHFDDGEDVILLDGVDTDGNTRRRKPAEVTTSSRKKASASALANSLSADTHGQAGQSTLEGLDSRDALQQLRSKGRRSVTRASREQRAKTAGSQWYDMPAFPQADADRKAGPGSASSRYTNSARGPTAEEMRREVQAIRLRNALDPKRFYKGGTKDASMPQFAQLGRIISSPLEPQQTLTRAERGRTVVEELVKDAEASSYAKRKFGEHQAKASSGGRGHSKAKKKKPSDRKRQRR
ncbi:unnamed protein product [Parajaminaea phylloscopi]